MDKCIICDVETLKYKCPKCLARYECGVVMKKRRTDSKLVKSRPRGLKVDDFSVHKSCSVSCCRTHKEKCTETPVSETQSSIARTDTNVPNYPLWSAKVSNNFPREDLDDYSDMVQDQRLDSLRDNKQICELLCNPHLRAICENLVNSEKPSLDMAKVMQEPIFVELADECLRVVDRDNPHLIADESLIDDL